MTNEEIDKVNSTPLYFVIGKERSGTTLLQVMLNAHPNIVAPPESRFIMRLYLKYEPIRQWTEKRIREFCDDLFFEAIFSNYWGIDKGKLTASLIGVKDKLTYPLLCKMVYCHFEVSKDAHMYIDKNPLYLYFVPELNSMFPAAKYVHIVRDYHANIVSHKRVASVRLDIADMAYRWKRVNMLIEETKAKMPGQWFTLKYETLVTQPVEVIKPLCDFLGVAYNPVMVEKHIEGVFPGFYKNYEQSAFQKYHQNVFKPISTDFIDDWKTKLTDKEVATMEAVTGKYARDTYEYKMHSEQKNYRVNPLLMMKVKVKYNAIVFYFKVLLRRRLGYYIHRYVIRHLLHLTR